MRKWDRASEGPPVRNRIEIKAVIIINTYTGGADHNLLGGTVKTNPLSES